MAETLAQRSSTMPVGGETTPQLSLNLSSNPETSAVNEKEKQIRKDQRRKDLEVMHQSIPAVPPPPGQPRGIFSRCQSRGWDIRNFIAARGLGICIPQGVPWAFDTRVLRI